MSQRAAARAGARPLGGRTIVVTRAAAQAQRFTQLLQEAGARVLEAPAIVIAPPPSWDPLDTALGQLESFRWVVFTSVNGVAMVDRRLVACGLGWGAMTGRGVAAIGPATADALGEHGVRPDIVPDEYRAEALAARLAAAIEPGDRVLLPRAGCCGRTMLSVGMVDEAARAAAATASALAGVVEHEQAVAVVGCEPSCVSAVVDDWPDLRGVLDDQRLRRLTERTHPVEDFIEERWDRHPRPLRARAGVAAGTGTGGPPVLLHGHCHQKALFGLERMASLLRRFVGERL